MKKILFRLSIALISLFLISGFEPTNASPISGLPSGNGITPIVIAGNPSAVDLGYDFGFKPQPEPPPSGDYTFPDGINTVTIFSDGIHFDWASTLGIAAVIVKGGPNSNIFKYNPDSFADTLLHAPINPNSGKLYDLSHIEFAYNTPVPIPAPILLLGSGFVGIIGLRRKRIL
jgi:hypothetical protein